MQNAWDAGLPAEDAASMKMGFDIKQEIIGDIAQLGERLPCKQEVAGSIPTISTN